MLTNHAFQFSVATLMLCDKATTKPQWHEIGHICFCLHTSDQSWNEQGLCAGLQSAGLAARQPCREPRLPTALPPHVSGRVPRLSDPVPAA